MQKNTINKQAVEEYSPEELSYLKMRLRIIFKNLGIRSLMI